MNTVGHSLVTLLLILRMLTLHHSSSHSVLHQLLVVAFFQLLPFLSTSTCQNFNQPISFISTANLLKHHSHQRQPNTHHRSHPTPDTVNRQQNGANSSFMNEGRVGSAQLSRTQQQLRLFPSTPVHEHCGPPRNYRRKPNTPLHHPVTHPQHGQPPAANDQTGKFVLVIVFNIVTKYCDGI